MSISSTDSNVLKNMVDILWRFVIKTFLGKWTYCKLYLKQYFRAAFGLIGCKWQHLYVQIFMLPISNPKDLNTASNTCEETSACQCKRTWKLLQWYVMTCVNR